MQPDLKSPRDEPTSPTSVPLPVSPQSSHGEFEALIELLASDEAPVNRPKSNIKARGGQSDLRDANGQLDFSKIKNMFASSGGGNHTMQNKDNLALSEDFQIGNIESKTHTGSVKSSTTLPLRTSSIPTLNLSPVSHITLNSQAFDAGLPPAESTPIHTFRTHHDHRGGHRTADPSFGPPWHTELGRNENLFNDTHDDSETLTPALLSLKKALDLAQREILDLRQRCRKLEDQHAPSEHSTSRNNLGTMVLDPSTSPLHAQDFDINTSLENTRPAPPSDDIHRALRFVAFVDELVWKRNRFGAAYDNPYGAENVQALQERLELWEQAVRTRR